MSILDKAQTPGDRPLIATILGDAGMGKTRLAASFPKTIFIRAEDGMQSIPRDQRPAALPKLGSVADLWEQLTALCNEDHNYKTLVIDSVTSLERLFGDDVLKKDGKAKALAQAIGGYGAGYQAVGVNHQRVRKAAGYLNDRRGMNVIFIAHADVETIKSPDLDDFMRYTLRLNQKYSLAPYVDDVDLVGFVRLQSFVKGDDDERKRVISTDQRELIVSANASNVSKNRFGLTKAMPFAEGENPLAAVIPHIIGAAAPEPAKAGGMVESTAGEDASNDEHEPAGKELPSSNKPAVATEVADQ